MPEVPHQQAEVPRAKAWRCSFEYLIEEKKLVELRGVLAFRKLMKSETKHSRIWNDDNNVLARCLTDLLSLFSLS